MSSSLKDDFLWRYATKKFDSTKKVSDVDLNDLLDALHYAPSSYGLQPWHFLVITDEAKRKELRPHAWDQPQITDASHLIVLCTRTNMDEAYVQKFIENVAAQRGTDISELDGYKQMIVQNILGMSAEERQSWMQRQVYIALGFLMSACMQKQIDSCPMEGFSAEEFDQILGLTEKGWAATVLCPVGYRSADDKYAELAKVRWERDEVIETL